MIKGLMCDLDDTLYSFADIREEAFTKLTEKVVNELGVSEKKFICAYREGRKQIKEEMKGEQAARHSRLLYCQRTLEILGMNPVEHASEFYHFFWETCFENMQLRSGVKELFLFVRNQGIKICICTDMQTEIQFQKIRRLGLLNLIDAIVTSEETGIEKPDAFIFQKGLQKMGIKNTECLYIGDSYEKDINGALECGIPAVLFEENAGSIWEKKGKYYVTGNFECIQKYLEEKKGSELEKKRNALLFDCGV